MVRAEHPEAALERVLTQGAGRLRLAYKDKGEGQGDRRRSSPVAWCVTATA
jgi:hypothetical protein